MATQRSRKAEKAHVFSNRGEAKWAWTVPLGLLILVTTLVPLQMLDEQGLPRCRELQREKATLAKRNQGLKEEIRVLRREAQALRHSPRALERLARHELGFVREDEIVFQFVP